MADVTINLDERDALDQLRAELRDVRYLTEAILMSLVGSDKIPTYDLNARVASTIRREDRGTPLRGLVKEPALLTLTSSRGMDLATLEELAGQPRERIAAIDGLGRKTMQRLDAAMAERGLSWAVAS